MTDRKAQERARKSPVNRMIDEDYDPVMQRDADPRHMVSDRADEKSSEEAA